MEKIGQKFAAKLEEIDNLKRKVTSIQAEIDMNHRALGVLHEEFESRSRGFLGFFWTLVGGWKNIRKRAKLVEKNETLFVELWPLLGKWNVLIDELNIIVDDFWGRQ